MSKTCLIPWLLRSSRLVQKHHWTSPQLFPDFLNTDYPNRNSSSPTKGSASSRLPQVSVEIPQRPYQIRSESTFAPPSVLLIKYSLTQNCATFGLWTVAQCCLLPIPSPSNLTQSTSVSSREHTAPILRLWLCCPYTSFSLILWQNEKEVEVPWAIGIKEFWGSYWNFELLLCTSQSLK